jgi:hypothetical protein
MPRPRIRRRRDDVDPWQTVSAGITDIVRKVRSCLSLASLHSAVAALLSDPSANQLTRGLRDIVSAQFREWQAALSALPRDSLVGAFGAYYRDFETYCATIPKFYMLYDRRLPAGDAAQTRQLLRQWFAEIVLGNAALMHSTIAALLAGVAAARVSHDAPVLADHAIVIRMLYSFRGAGAAGYFASFFDQFRVDTGAFYGEFFQARFGQDPFPAYLQITQAQFDHEEAIVRQIFEPKEQTAVLVILHSQVLVSQEDQFLTSAKPPAPIALALTAPDPRPMRWLVDTYRRFGLDLTDVYTACAEFVHAEMAAMAPNFKQDMKSTEVLKEVGDLMQKAISLTTVFSAAFRDIPKARDVLEARIKAAWNMSEFRIFEMFATYLDQQIQGEFRTLREEDRVGFPQTVGLFYSRIEDKTSFKEYYTSQMLRRFIRLRASVCTHEFMVVSAIRRAKMPDFAKEYNDLLRKVTAAVDLEAEFNQSVMGSNDPALQNLRKIKVSPLTIDMSLYKGDKIEARDLPAELNELHTRFTAFYTAKHQKSRLTLLADASDVELKVHIGSRGAYVLVVDLQCATIISVIVQATNQPTQPNQPPSPGGITFGELSDRVASHSLAYYLTKLCHREVGLLKRQASGDSRKVQAGDRFWINTEGVIPRRKQRVAPMPPMRAPSGPGAGIRADTTQETIERSKSDAIKGAAVRVMKQRNRLEQSALETEIQQALSQHFRTDVKMVRRILEEITVEGYVERNAEGGQVIFSYTA